MISFEIICIGPLKDLPYQRLQQYYLQLISKYSKIHVHEISDEAISKSLDREVILKKEEVKILKYIDPHKPLIILDEKGREYSSIDFSNWIKKQDEKGVTLQFLIGGAYGISDTLKSQAHLKLGLSELTLPHQLARIVLLEQLYRSCTLIHGKQYHY